MPADIVIVDYGAGNLRSVQNALRSLGHEPTVSASAQDVAGARAVILPGVGAASSAMQELERLGLVNALMQHMEADRPFLGVCLGLQLLLTVTEEGGLTPCLGVIPGWVKKLSADLKIPHMGWNQVRQRQRHPIFAGIPDNSNFYFVHSYYGEAEDKALVVGETEYGVTFGSVIARGNLIATQFHPEKSGEMGLKLYDNFLKLALGESPC